MYFSLWFGLQFAYCKIPKFLRALYFVNIATWEKFTKFTNSRMLER